MNPQILHKFTKLERSSSFETLKAHKTPNIDTQHAWFSTDPRYAVQYCLNDAYCCKQRFVWRSHYDLGNEWKMNKILVNEYS